MRNKNRIPLIIKTLEDVWVKNPDLRLGQLIQVAAKRGGWKENDLFYVEDSLIQNGLDKLKETLNKELSLTHE